jgi:hypothetical protein
MTDVTSEAVAVANGAAKKVNRRGVSNKTVAAARLKFHEKDASPANGLFMAHLDSVSVEWSQNADGNSFAGLKMPRLVVTFASNHENAKERRYVTKTFFPVESNVDTIPGGKNAWQVDAILNWTKHLLDVFYLHGRELTSAEEDALTLTFEDFTEDENGNIEYKAVDPQDVLDGYRNVFDGVAAMLNGQFNLSDGETAKPCFKDANGKAISCWIKLLRATRNRKGEWVDVDRSKDLSFTSFVGSGAVELVKMKDGKVLPPVILTIDKVKESITPKQTNKTPTVGVPGVPGMPGMAAGGTVVPPMGTEFNSPAGSAFDPTSTDDMPF